MGRQLRVPDCQGSFNTCSPGQPSMEARSLFHISIYGNSRDIKSLEIRVKIGCVSAQIANNNHSRVVTLEIALRDHYIALQRCWAAQFSMSS